MQIKLKTLYASPDKIYQVGELGNFSKEEGQALIDGKFGILIEPIVIEKAIIKPVEIAVIHPDETVINSAENLIPKQKIVKANNKPKRVKK